MSQLSGWSVLSDDLQGKEVWCGHKQFTQQLLTDLHLTLPEPLNQPPAPGTPSPALPPQAPSRHSLTSLRPQGLSSGGRFYSSDLSDSSPQGTPGDSSLLCSIYRQEMLSPYRDTAENCPVHKEMRALYNEGFIMDKRGANITK